MARRRGLRIVPNAGRLRDAILSLAPTAYWPLDDGAGPLRDIAGGWNAAVTGSPTFRVAAQDPIERGVTWSGTGQYATTSGSVPTPAASVSVACMFRTTNATAATRAIFSRGATNQNSWQLDLSSANAPRFLIFTTTAGSTNGIQVGGAANDGRWHLMVGTSDGSFVRGYRASAAGFTVGTPLADSIVWHLASTAGLQVAARADATPFPGDTAHAAYWNDRVLTEADARWLGTIAFGG